VPQTVVTLTSNYSFVAGDEGKIFVCYNSAPITLTLISYRMNTMGVSIDIIAATGNTVTVASGDTTLYLYGTPGLKLRAQWSSASIVQFQPGQWLLTGDLSA